MPTTVGSGVEVGVCDHVVEFYERDAALVESVADYLAGPLRAGGVAIVIATKAHRRAFARRLAALGAGPPAVDERAVVWIDAAEALASVMPAGRVDAKAFHLEVGSAIAEAAAAGGPVCVYGEMVQLLWDAGKVVAVLELESLWNEVIGEHRCSLMCAYRSSSVSGAEHSEALARVCELHSSVVHAPQLQANVPPAHLRRATTSFQAAPPVNGPIHARSSPMSVRAGRSERSGLYRRVADTLERSAELFERHAWHERDNGRQLAAIAQLQHAERAREAARRARDLASRMR